jgi:riboflavin kinase / FMN adenylyltransferase
VITTLDLSDLTGESPPAVVSIGVFDGVHLGHQAILAANVARARERGARPTVVTFRHHPKELLLGHAPRTLTTLEHRLELFRRAGIEHCVALTFDEDLRSMPAEAFAKDLLVRNLGATSFVLGFDSKFGAGRTGGPDLLRAMGYDVEVVEKVVLSQRAVSSTAIREAVELGDLAGAARMLGRPVSVFGEVVQGAQLGRTLGFPTANLDLHHELHPPVGVYACRAHRVDPLRTEVAATHLAVANIGFRPTVEGTRPERPLVEVHLLDFEADLYGEHLELEFVCQLREERRFDGLDALKAQIALDVAAGRERLADSGPSL